MDWEESIPNHKPFSAASTDGSGIEIDELDIGDHRILFGRGTCRTIN